MDNRLKNLDYVFNPRSIAFVGATETVGKWGFIIPNNIISGGYEGKFYPVNPGRDSVLGHKAYPTVRDIPDEVDLAVFTVPAKQVVKVIDDCVARGVKGGVVISAGFKELGGEFVDLEAELVAKARAGGMVLTGPNGLGVGCPLNKLYSWMPNFYPPPGNVAVVSQSGNVQNMLINGVVKQGFGISKAVSSGNEADLRVEDYYEYYSEDPSTEVIMSYIEGLSDGRRFIEKARAAARKKPIIVLKGGRTPAGVHAAKSHTGAMAVSDRLFDAVCKQAGLVRTHVIDEVGAIAASFLNRPLPRGRRLGILTGGGGLGVIAADACTDEGLEIVELSSKTLDKLGKLLPAWWVPGNPVDLVAGLDFGSIKPILEILMKSGEVDSILLIFIGPPPIKGVRTPKSDKGVDISKFWDTITQLFGGYVGQLYDMMHELQIPLYVVSNFGPDGVISLPEDKNMVVYSSIETGCRAISAMTRYYEYSGAIL